MRFNYLFLDRISYAEMKAKTLQWEKVFFSLSSRPVVPREKFLSFSLSLSLYHVREGWCPRSHASYAFSMVIHHGKRNERLLSLLCLSLIV